MIPVLLLFMILVFPSAVLGQVSGRIVLSRPPVVSVGAIFSYNSAIGSVAKIAIETAVEDVNSNSSVLGGTKLIVTSLDSNGSGFIGIVEALRFMEKDTIAIIGPQSSMIAHAISHVANELKVPLLSFAATDPTLSSLQYPFFVRTTQSDLYQMSAIADVIDYYNWKEVAAIFIDDDYGRNGIAALGDKLEEKRCRISYKAAMQPQMTRNDVTDMLARLALMESRVIVVHINNPILGLLIFSVAEHLRMISTGYVWITTDAISSYLDTYSVDLNTMSSLEGVLMLRQHIPDSDQKRSFTSRWSDLVKKRGLHTLGLNTYGLYAYDTVWLIAHAINDFLDGGGTISFSDDPNLINLGGNMNLKALSVFDAGDKLLKEILRADFVGLIGQIRFNSDKHLVRPAYDILNFIEPGSRVIGYWSIFYGLSVEPPEKIANLPLNISNQELRSVIWPGQTTEKPRGWVFPNNGRQLKIGVPNRFSYKEFVSLVKGTDVMRGFCTDVFIAAASKLPYPVSYKFMAFGNGEKNPNYSELIRQVATGFYDAAVGDIAIITSRTKMVDFTQPYTASGLVVVASTKRTKSGAWAFLRSFSFKMWCANAIFFLMMGLVVWTLEHRVNDEFRGPPIQQMATILWFSFSTMFFAHRETTRSTLGRFVLVIWLFVVLIINSSYTASLTSILTVQQLSSPITGIESLLASEEPIGYQVGSFAKNYLLELGVPKSRLKSLGSPEAYATALEQGPANGGVIAVVDERAYIQMFLSKHCEFNIRGMEFTKSGWGFVSIWRIDSHIPEEVERGYPQIAMPDKAFPRGSPLADDFSTAILSLAESGELQRIHDKWLTYSCCSSQNADLSSNQLDLRSFWGLFLLSGIASIVALCIFFGRMLIILSRRPPPEGRETPELSNRSRRLRTFLSFVDEKEDVSRGRHVGRTRTEGRQGNSVVEARNSVVGVIR